MSVDEAACLNRVGGDRELLRELIELFAEEKPGNLAKIDAAIAARDADALHVAAHTLKGGVSIFCPPGTEAYEAAFALERMGKTGTWDGIDAARARLVAALAAIEPELQRLAQDRSPT